jgi:hypothetical protein
MIFRAVWRDQYRPLQNRRQLQFVDAPDELDVIFKVDNKVTRQLEGGATGATVPVSASS